MAANNYHRNLAENSQAYLYKNKYANKSAYLSEVSHNNKYFANQEPPLHVSTKKLLSNIGDTEAKKSMANALKLKLNSNNKSILEKKSNGILKGNRTLNIQSIPTNNYNISNG